jgi:enoyl-CoA hydratase
MSREDSPRDQIHVEREGRVQIWRIDYPPHNFMTRVMVRELSALVEDVAGDEVTGAVVITGSKPGVYLTHYEVREILAGSEGVGKAMPAGLAGASLRAVGGLARVPGADGALRRTPASGLLELQDLHDLFLRMNGLGKVFICAINGPATGGGCELAVACDLRYMADDAERIGLPEMTLGFAPGGGGTQRLPRLMGQGRALEMLLEGRTLPPEEALAAGLVNRVIPSGRLLDAAIETGERLSRRAPMSVEGLKRAVYQGSSSPLPAGLAIERKWFMAAVSQPEAVRAMRTFAEELEETGHSPWTNDESLARWREGERADLGGPSRG